MRARVKSDVAPENKRTRALHANVFNRLSHGTEFDSGPNDCGLLVILSYLTPQS